MKTPGAPQGEVWQLGLHLQIPCLNEAVLQCPAQGHGGDSLVVCWPDTGEERIPPGLHALNTEPSSAQAGLFYGLSLGSAMAEAGTGSGHPICSRERLLGLWAVLLWQWISKLPSVLFQATVNMN